MATVIDLADAVVTVLNDVIFNLPLVAERWYVPVRDQADLTGISYPIASVVPGPILGNLLNRAGAYMEIYEIIIGVQQSIQGTNPGPMTNAEIKTATDPLMTLMEQIVQAFAAQPIDGVPGAICTAHRYDVTYSPEHIDQRRIFTGVLTLTYKLSLLPSVPINLLMRRSRIPR